MKIGILSVNINTEDLNHGAVLHSWAFQQFIKKNKIGEPEIINYYLPGDYGKNLRFPIFSLLKKKKYKAALVSLISMHSYGIRYRKFKAFAEKEMHLTKKAYSREILAKENLDYDVIVCESDVIWDPNFFGGSFDSTFFLDLSCMKNMRRVAYSPSMGNCQLTSEQTDVFKSLISNLDAISCRESYETEFIRNECNVNAITVLDPVLLLQASDFSAITTPSLVECKYLLLYTPVGYDIKLIIEAHKYAKKKGLKVIEISRYPWDKFFHNTFSDAGVEEFLALFANADYVFTNSFHGVCFSVIFHKEFLAFARKTGKKTEDLCFRLGLSERYLKDVELVSRKFKKIDYEKVEKILNDNRLISEQFIKMNIKTKNDEKKI